METTDIPFIDGDHCVSLCLYTGVRNAGKLRALATSGNLNAALLDPILVSSCISLNMLNYYNQTFLMFLVLMFCSLYILSQICGCFHVQCAVYKAVVAKENGQMKTRNLNSEIIYSLSSSTNVCFLIIDLLHLISIYIAIYHKLYFFSKDK